MPHISQHKLAERAVRELEEQVSLFIVEAGGKTRRHIFKEILTSTEHLMIAKRLLLILLIAKGGSTRIISAYLKMSPSTVARFERQMEQGKYKNTQQWLQSQSGTSKVMRILEQLASIPFEARRKSLYRLVDEM